MQHVLCSNASMKAESYTSDLSSVLERINNGDIDLQPDFQRGLVWPRAKQARLIDTVLRNWAIPPIHFIVNPDDSLSVLDGQQRLTALRDFSRDEFKISTFAPEDETLKLLKGLRFSQMNDAAQRRFFKYRIPCYEIYDFEPEEPYELFFRLNQPTGLTSAEKRNALFGDARHQISELVKSTGWDFETLGFTNTRKSYEDVAARACVLIENGRLDSSLRSQKIDEYYRTEGGFSEITLDLVRNAMNHLANAIGELKEKPKFNKATLLSWIIVIAYAGESQVKLDCPLALKSVELSQVDSSLVHYNANVLRALLSVYRDRSSLRVTDVLSVLARDFCIWQIAIAAGAVELTSLNEKLQAQSASMKSVTGGESIDDIEGTILKMVEQNPHWGVLR